MEGVWFDARLRATCRIFVAEAATSSRHVKARLAI
jgi:hypothetical protein